MAYMTAVTIWSTVTIIGYFMDNPYGWLVTRFLAGASSLAYNTVSDVYRYIHISSVYSLTLEMLTLVLQFLLKQCLL